MFKSTKKTKDPTKNRAVSDTAKVSEKTIIKNESSTVVPKQMFSSRVANEQPLNVSGKGRSSTPQTTKKTLVKGVVSRQAAESSSTASISKSLSSSSIKKTTTGKSIKTITTVDQDGNIHTTVETVDDIPQSTTETTTEESNTADSANEYVEYADQYSFEGAIETPEGLNSPRYSSNRLTSSQNFENESSSVDQSMSTETNYNTVTSHVSSESKQLLDAKDTIQHENTVRSVNGKLIKSIDDMSRDNSNYSYSPNISGQVDFTDTMINTNINSSENKSSSATQLDEIKNFNYGRNHQQINNESIELKSSANTFNLLSDLKEKASTSRDHENKMSKDIVDNQDISSGLTVKMIGGKLIKQFNTPSTSKQSQNIVNTKEADITYNVDSNKQQYQNNVKTSFESEIIDQNVSTDKSNDYSSEMFITQKYIPIFSRSNQEIDEITSSSNENSKTFYDKTNKIDDPRYQNNTEYNTKDLFGKNKNVDNDGLTVRMVGGKLIKSFKEPTKTPKNVSNISTSSNISNSDISSGDIITSTSFTTNEQSSISSSFGETHKSNSKTSSSVYQTADEQDTFKNQKQPDLKNNKLKNEKFVDNVDDESLRVRVVGGKLIKTFNEPTTSKKNIVDASKSSNISRDISSSDITTSTSFSTNEQTSVSSSFVENDHSNFNTSKSMYQSVDRPDETKHMQRPDNKKEKSKPNKSVENVDEEGLTVRVVGGKLIKTFNEPTPSHTNNLNVSKSSNISTSDILSGDITKSTSFISNEQSSLSSSYGENDQSNSKTSNSVNQKPDRPNQFKNKEQQEVKNNKFKSEQIINNVDEEGLNVRIVGGKVIKTFNEPTTYKQNNTDTSKSSNISTSDISSSNTTTSTSFSTNELTSVTSSHVERDQTNINASKSVYQTSDRPYETKNTKQLDSKEDESKQNNSRKNVDEEGLTVRMVGGKLIKKFNEPTPSKKNSFDVSKSSNISSSDISSGDISSCEISSGDITTSTSYITNEQSSFSSSFGETNQSSINTSKTSKSENEKSNDFKNKKQPESKKDMSPPITTVDIVDEEGLSVRMVGGKLIKTFKEPTPSKKNTTNVSKSSNISTSDISTSTSFSTNEQSSLSGSFVERDQSNIEVTKSLYQSPDRSHETKNAKSANTKKDKSISNKSIENVDEEGLSVRMVGGKLIKTFKEPTPSKKNTTDMSKSTNILTSDISSSDISTSTSFITNEQSSFSSSFGETDQSSINASKTSKFENKKTDDSKNKKQPATKKDMSKPITTVDIVDEEGLSVRMVGGKLIKTFKEPTPTKKNTTDVLKSSNILTSDISSSDISTSTSFITNEQSSFSSSFGETDQSSINASKTSKFENKKIDDSKNKKQPETKKDLSKPITTVDIVDEEGLSVRMVGGKLIKTFKEPTATKKNTTDMSKSSNILTSDISSSDISTSTSFITNEQSSFSSSFGETDQSSINASKTSKFENKKTDDSKNKKQPATKKDLSKPITTVDIVDEEGLSVRMVGGKLIKTFKEPTPTKKNTTDMSKSTNILTSDISSSDISTSTSFITNEQSSFSSSFGETDQSSINASKTSKFENKKIDDSKNKKQPETKKDLSKPITTVDIVDEEGLSVRMVGGKLIKTFKEPTPTKKNTIEISKSSNSNNVISDISSNDITTSSSFITNEQSSFSSSLEKTDQSDIKTSTKSKSVNKNTDQFDESKNKKQPIVNKEKSKPNKPVEKVDEEGLSVRMVGGKLIKTFKEPTPTKKTSTDESKSSDISTSDISSRNITTSTSFSTNEHTSVSSSTGETDQSDVKTFNSVYRIDRPDEINNKKQPDAKKEKSKPNKPVEKVDEEGLSVRMVGGKLIKTFKEPTPTKKTSTDESKSSDISTSDISSRNITTSTSFSTNEHTSVSSSTGETDQSDVKTFNSVYRIDRPDEINNKKQPDVKKEKSKPNKPVEKVDEEGLSVRMVGGKLIKTFKEPTPTKKTSTDESKSSDISTSDISSRNITTSTSFSTNEHTSVSSSTGETDQSDVKTFNSVYRIDRPDEINNKKQPDVKKEKSKPNKPVEKVDEEGLSVRMVGGKLIKTFKEPTPTKKNTTDVLKSSNILTSDISSRDITTSFTTNEQTSVSSSYVESDQSSINKISKTSNSTNQKTDRSDVTKSKKRPEAKIDKPKPKTTVDNVDEEGLSVRMVGGKLIKTFKEPSRNVVKNTSKSNTLNTNLNSQRTSVNVDTSSQVLNTTYIIDESSSNNEVIKTVKTSNDSSSTIVDGKTVKSYKGPERSPRKPKSDEPDKTNADVMPFDNNYTTSVIDAKHVHDIFYDVSEESYIESRQFSEQSIVQDFQVTSNTSEYYPERPARNRDVRDNIVVQDITDFVSVSSHAEVIENRKTSEVVFEKSVVKGMTENYENRVSSSKKVQENKVDKKPRHQKEITAAPKEQCICEICTCGRHRCPHTPGTDRSPLDLEPISSPKLSRTKEEYQPIPFDRIERPSLQRLNTELTINEGKIENTTAYKSEFEEKHAERQVRYKMEDQLHLEGDYSPQRKQEYTGLPGDRYTSRKPQDNLKPEGDFERPTREKVTPAERPKPIKPIDNLKPEGDFERPQPSKYGPGERAPIVKHPDNLKPEGDFERPTREKVTPAERSKPIKPSDNLKPEGDFERPQPSKYGPGERAPIVKHPDNLRPEGEFERPIREKVSPAERPRPIKPSDNLKPEGDFERPQPSKYGPGDRAPIVKHPDNLKPEGDFERPTPTKVQPADRQKPIRPKDNLRPEGEFDRPIPSQYGPGDRAPIVKHPDNLKSEGDFDRPKPNKYAPGDRAPIVKHPDNLKSEGDFDRPEQPQVPKRGERAPIKKPIDNLRPEGEFYGERTVTKIVKGERAEIRRHEDQLVIGGEFTDTTTQKTEFTGEATDRPRMIRRNTWTKLEGDILVVPKNKEDYPERPVVRSEKGKKKKIH